MKILKVRHVTGARSYEDQRIVAEHVVSFNEVKVFRVGEENPWPTVVRIHTSDGRYVDVASPMDRVEEALIHVWDGRPL